MSGTLTVPANGAWATIPVTVDGTDSRSTDNGHFGLQPFDATGGVIDDEGEGPSGIIVNTIGVLTANVEADNVTVPHRATAGTASFRVYLNHPARVATSVHYATSDGSQDPNAPSSAAQAGTDYTATSGTVNLPAGATTATVAVPVLPLAAHGAPRTARRRRAPTTSPRAGC